MIKRLFTVLAVMAMATANAATLSLEFDASFGNTADPDQNPPGGIAPWLTAVFDDGGSTGSVSLTMNFGADNTGETVNDVYFNLDDALDASSLSYSNVSGPNANVGTTGIIRADGSGLYDLIFDFKPPPQGADTFAAGDTVVYNITGAGLTAGSFNYKSELEIGSTTTAKYAAAQIQSTGTGEQSDWVAAVPVPAAVWLFGSALAGLGFMRRRNAA
jgi:hypothetical protein